MKEERTQREIFGENLRRIMRDKELSQRRLAYLMGVSGASVNAWCQGASLPNKTGLEHLCKTLNVSHQDLMLDRENIRNLSVPAARPLPMLGTICAGDGILAEQNFDGYFFIDNSIRADFCLRVEGNSMTDAHIYHGDIAFIKKSYELVDGKIYAVVFDDTDSASLKVVYKQDDGLLLTPCNSKYKPILVQDAFIVGECIGVYHSR